MSTWISRAGNYSSRAMTRDDRQAVCRLFQTVFGKEMSDALWEWKYGNDRGTAILVYRGDELVAHYGGLDREILYDDERVRVAQIVDVMVDTSARHPVRTGNPFFIAGRDFQDVFSGVGKRYPFGFGFPSDRHLKLAQYMGLYAPVGTMVETSWQLSKPVRLSFSRLQEIDAGNFENHCKAIDSLWRLFADSFADCLIGVRDSQYIRHRYLHHPEKNFELYLLKGVVTGKPEGLIVLQHLDEEKSLLMDLVGPRRKMQTLIRQACRIAGRQGQKVLKAWSCQNFAELFDINDALQKPLAITIPLNIRSKGPAQSEIEGRWWLMAGDTDFL